MRKSPRPADETFSLTPMIDMSFLLIVFFILLPLKGLDAKLSAHMPRDAGIVPDNLEEPKDTVKIRVRRDGEALEYTLGQHSAPKADGLSPVIRALGPQYAYEIDATPAVPWQGVIDAVNVLAASECTDVRFRGGRMPARHR